LRQPWWINLEDIKAPEFEIERRLVEELNIPVMHDDQAWYSNHIICSF
jgi:malic enzyme